MAQSTAPLWIGLSLAALFAGPTTGKGHRGKTQKDTDEGLLSSLSVKLEPAFPRLRFKRPVFLCGSSDESGRLFVLEQDGVIRVFDRDDDIQESRVFLDITDRVSRQGNEEGLLGFAIDPENPDVFYVHYSSSIKDMTGIVARYWVSVDDPNRADPHSEEIILEQSQPYRNHNGGMIAFGPDGYLYIGLGDGGSANDPHNNGQDLSTRLASILRIDVRDETDDLPYAIPSDNPFVDIEGAAPEIWAYGLRNPWRFSFDSATGELWTGDVGQNRYEEVDLIRRGGNYGWRPFEASSKFSSKESLKSPQAEAKHELPIAEYERSSGISITGGYVYRGTQSESFEGVYFYGDYFSGNLFAIRKNEEGGYDSARVRRTGKSISSFGQDDEGEVYVLSFDGRIYRIVESDTPENSFSDWPERLSETGLFNSLPEHLMASNVIPYEVNAPFWSDGASKNRYFVLPEGKTLGYRDSDAWDVPEGTTLVKSFSIAQFGRSMNVETRLIKRTHEGWEAASYVWEQDQREAILSPEGQQFEVYAQGVSIWHAPSASECTSCHVEAAGYTLGFNTAQLNRESSTGSLNQIEDWAQRRILDLPKDFQLSQAERFSDPSNTKSDNIFTLARVWLDVNCAMCHRPDGPGNASIDLRFTTPLSETGLVQVRPSQGDLGLEDPRLIVPKNPERSMLWHRIQTLGDGRMPNMATNRVDIAGAQLIREWIQQL